MADLMGFAYAVILCGLGGFTAQCIYQFLRPKIGVVWSGGVAAMVAFFIMVMVASLTQILFAYPPITGT